MDIQNGNFRQLTFWSEEHLANPLASLDSEKGLKIQGETSCLPILESLKVENLDGLCGKMFPVCCPLTEEGILLPSSQRWGTWGMGGHTECWTLNGSEFPKEGKESLLSDILETGILPQRFYLSQKACAGILRRAKKRGKELPELLKIALESVALEDQNTQQ